MDALFAVVYVLHANILQVNLGGGVGEWGEEQILQFFSN